VVIGNILFFLMMFAPAGWQFIKIPLVIISVALLILHYMRSVRKKMSITVITWFAFLLSYGLVWNVIGAFRGNPGVTDTFRLNVIWVVLYAVYIFYIDSRDKFNSLVKTMVWATIAISIYNFAIVLSAFDILPDVNALLKVDDELTSAIGIHAGFIQLTSNNIGSLTFLVPFVLVLYVMKSGSLSGVSKIILKLSVILSIITVLVSGRRALWVEMLVTPFLILLINYFNSEKRSKRTTIKIIKFYSIAILLLVVSGSIMAYSLNWDVSLFIERFTAAFESGSVRHEQAAALFNGFTESPLSGPGFGVGVHDVVRSDLRPWTYELSYVLMLYNTGVLGTALYFVCIVIIYLFYFKYLKNGSYDNAITSSLLVAFTCFIIANSTNPYLGSYDYMWMFYLPIAYINVVQLERRGQLAEGYQESVS
jgi:hypothetical protein